MLKRKYISHEKKIEKTMNIELNEYKDYLLEDRNRWFIDQIKHGMMMGYYGLKICNLPQKGGYKKAKHIFNFWKWKGIESPYYYKDLNILITNQGVKKSIDIIGQFGLGWYLSIDWDVSIFPRQIYTLNVKLPIVM
jgi:hypothetical protein